MNLISCIFLSRPFLVAQLALWHQHPEPKTVVDTRHRATCEEFLMCGHYCARVTIFAHFGRPYGRPLNPSMTSLDSYPSLRVRLIQNCIILVTQDKLETLLLCHAMVTILVHFGAPHGQPHDPSPSNFYEVIKDKYHTHQEL